MRLKKHYFIRHQLFNIVAESYWPLLPTYTLVEIARWLQLQPSSWHPVEADTGAFVAQYPEEIHDHGQIMNLLWTLSDKGPRVRFSWVPSHCGIAGNEIVDQLVNEAIDHGIDPLTTVHFADLKPLVNSYVQQEVQIKGYVSIHGRDLYLLKPTLGPPKRFRHLTRIEEVVITRLRIGHTKATKSNILCWGPPTACPAMWSDSDNWAHTPWMCSVATKSW